MTTSAPAKRRRSRRCRRWSGIAVVIAGIVVLGSGLVQPLKAAVGHHLLQSTFDSRLAAEEGDRSNADQWRPWPGADVAPIAELHFPTLGQDRVVLDSASGEALAWGVGHVPGTADLGSTGIAAVAGHRDGRFELLGDLHEGDQVALTTIDGETVHYVVETRTVVDSRRVELPIDHGGPSELLLTTCWPIDGLLSGPERLILHARPIGSP